MAAANVHELTGKRHVLRGQAGCRANGATGRSAAGIDVGAAALVRLNLGPQCLFLRLDVDAGGHGLVFTGPGSFGLRQLPFDVGCGTRASGVKSLGTPVIHEPGTVKVFAHGRFQALAFEQFPLSGADVLFQALDGTPAMVGVLFRERCRRFGQRILGLRCRLDFGLLFRFVATEGDFLGGEQLGLELMAQQRQLNVF